MNRIQQVFREHADAYMASVRITDGERKVIRAIRDCRSGECGYHLYQCPDCGCPHGTPSSCDNRHCPVCQQDKNAAWVHKQQLKRLPCTYFMATFTLPEELRPLALAHPKAVYDALMDSAADSLRTLEADPRFVGCKIAGFSGILHTWGRQMQFHPHVHFIIPGGGLSADRERWIAAKGDFLVHVRALSRMFRGKMKERLRKEALLDRVPPAAWCTEWNVHCKAVGNGERVLKYLGTYVFRVVISDARITRYDGETVTIKYQKVGSSRWRHLTFNVIEFMRRYLQHVLPRGFMKVRHYGFLAPNFSVSLQRIRELICILYETLRGWVLQVPDRKRSRPLICKECGTELRWMRFLPPLGRCAVQT